MMVVLCGDCDGAAWWCCVVVVVVAVGGGVGGGVSGWSCGRVIVAVLRELGAVAVLWTWCSGGMVEEQRGCGVGGEV